MFFIKFIDTYLKPLFLGISNEAWSLIIQLVVGILSFIAIFKASNTVVKWNEKNKKEKELNEVSYFLGCFQILTETMNYYHVGYLIGEDIDGKDIYSSDYLLTQIRQLVSEINKSKYWLAQLLSPYIDSKFFLELLFSLDNILTIGNIETDLECEIWDDLLNELKNFNMKMEKAIK